MAIKRADKMSYEELNMVCDEVSAGHVMIFDMAKVKEDKKNIISFLEGFSMATGTGLQKISQTNMMLTPAERSPFPKPEVKDDAPVKVHVVYAADENDATANACTIVGKGAAVVLNFENCSPEKMREDVDFVSGFCYGVDGQIKILADKLFLVVPEGIETDF